jgi:phage-related protein
MNVPKHAIKALYYQEANRRCPVYDFLQKIPPKSQERAGWKINLLKTFGHNLRRPHADYLCDGIYELRWKTERVHYQILYFFSGQNKIVLVHVLKKEKIIPKNDIQKALKRKIQYIDNPEKHNKNIETYA